MSSELSESEIESVIEALHEEGSLSLLFAAASRPGALADIPVQWRAILDPGAERIEVALGLWKSLEAIVPKTLEQLRGKLIDVAIALSADKPVSLVYFFRQRGEVMGQRGYAPANVAGVHDVPAALRQIVSPFYEVHDGWVDLFSADAGPLPVAQWRTSRDPQDPGQGGFLTIFSNASQAVGFDLSSPDPAAYALWPGDDEVEAIADFWAFIDEQMAAGLEDCDE